MPEMKPTVLLSLLLLPLVLWSTAATNDGARVTSDEAQQPPELLRDHPLQGLLNATVKLPTTSDGRGGSRRRSVESSGDARWAKITSGRSSSGSGKRGGTRGGTGSQSNRQPRSSKSSAQSIQLLRLRSSPSRIALPLFAFFAALLG